jgi:tetratricopeptide (TPR) repeat protein
MEKFDLISEKNEENHVEKLQFLKKEKYVNDFSSKPLSGYDSNLRIIIASRNTPEINKLDCDIQSCNIKVSNNNKKEILTKLEHLALLGMKHKENGNHLFKNENIEEALIEYYKALELFTFEDPIQSVAHLSNISMIKIECLNNIAVCYYVQNKYEKVLSITEKVLETRQSYNCLLLRIKALQALNRLLEAEEFIQKVVIIFILIIRRYK